jgi:hypothetical protein
LVDVINIKVFVGECGDSSDSKIGEEYEDVALICAVYLFALIGRIIIKLNLHDLVD